VTNFLIISIAAVLGANARYFLNRLAADEVGAFPYGTLLINVVGSLIAGFFIMWSSERILLDPRWRFLVVVGFCGSFTTFSGYAIESIGLINQGQWPLMLTNVIGSNLLCLGAAFAGMAIARVL
jgi:CrcB protein